MVSQLMETPSPELVSDRWVKATWDEFIAIAK